MTDSDRLSRLESDLNRYQERWRATDRIAEQRLTVLAAAITACVALVAIGADGDISHQVKSGIWFFAFALSGGTFHRLVQARLSIVRHIKIMNFIRGQIRDAVPANEKDYNVKLLQADGQVPPGFKLLSVQSATALTAVTAFTLSLREAKLWLDSVDNAPITISWPFVWLAPVPALGILIIYYITKASRHKTAL
uniref:hypothetical protein n=1 Tax=unclassified Rhodococcus (in: high G+C Gram-positive bacteria) TaxID=192944 RepID=UPI00113FF578|nr:MULTISPECIES: hypothetical protein [unclassified Rhodococcus (in: high G+C Gram-positive bacteria)]